MAANPPLSNKDRVSKHYEDFINRGDLSAADRDLRSDFIDHAAPPGTPPGPESAKNWIQMVRVGFPDITVREEQSIASGDMVGILAAWMGTHDGPFFGIEPTGRSVEMSGIVLWRIADGQLAERWAVLDYDTLLAAISGNT
jgi:predicted ester cyclase